MFKTILVPVDLEHEGASDKALAEAVRQAQISGAEVHVMAVAPTFGMSMVGQFFPDDYERKMLAGVANRLNALIEAKVPADLTSHAVVAHGVVYEEILHTASKIGADLIVVAAHRPELQDYLIGPNAARVVRHGLCSVLVVRD